MFRLDKRKIFLLYHYYLSSNLFNNRDKNENCLDEKEQKRLFWVNECLKNETYLREKISKKLKVGWEFSRLFPLEKAILIYATYELLFTEKSIYLKMIIDQTINFSKAYLEEGKYKYINKILDLLLKEKIMNDSFKVV